MSSTEGAGAATERVTDRFFRRYAAHHAALQGAIRGPAGPARRRRDASLLLDRLMVARFLEQAGFAAEAAALRHDVPDGQVPDRALARIGAFFDEFGWPLEDRPSGAPGAITPDVLGHVFERSINLTSSGQKQGGAYYTKNDVTGYMVAVTLVPRLLERLAARCGADWAALLRADPERYVPAAVLAPGPLADEAPPETRERHAHGAALLARLAAGAVDHVDGLIAATLDGRRLLADAVATLRDPAAIAAAWDEVGATTVLDPTCGSGAFLFAALGVLEDTYAALLALARDHGVAAIAGAADAHPNDPYFARHHAIATNLHGLDLMDEAIETARLRLFLALAARLTPGDALPPRATVGPGLRTGNLFAAGARAAVADGTFDVVLGNPPFIARGDVAYPLGDLATAGLPDVYAPCVERALALRAPAGRFAMVLPIAFQFSAGHAAARRVVLDQGSVWVATFSRNPSALFTASVGVRPIIVATSPAPGPVWTTATRRWTAAARGELFATLRYAALPERARAALWLPRTGDDGVAALVSALTASGATLGASAVRGGPFAVGFKAFALYYLAVYTTVPPVYDAARTLVAPPADKALRFATREDQLLAFALLAGELGLLWWMSTGDDFNLSGGTLRSLPIGLEQLAPRRAELLALAAALEAELHVDEHLLFTPYARLMTGSWDLRRVRAATRRFDVAVLETLGLAEHHDAVLRAAARTDRATGERNGTRRGTAWLGQPPAGA